MTDNIDKYLDIDNGITFCEICHLLFHNIYGRRNTTKEQLIDFIEVDS